MKKSHLFLIAILIILVSICFAEVYQEPQDFFQVDLPSEWHFDSTVAFTYYFSCVRNEMLADLIIMVADLEIDFDIYGLAADIEENDLIYLPGYTVIQESKTSIGGAPALKKLYTITEEQLLFDITFVMEDYYVISGKRAFWVQMRTTQIAYNQFSGDFKHFAETFKVGKGSVSDISTSAETIEFQGLTMAVYTAEDNSFSMYYPADWTVTLSEAGATITQDPANQLSPAIDLYPLQFEVPYSSDQIINFLADEMRMLYPSFNIISNNRISEQPDIGGVLFSYVESDVNIIGFAVSMTDGTQGMWADIYGPEDSFTGYNPSLLLTYILQSLNQGSAPNQPQIDIPEEMAGEAAATPSTETSSQPEPGSEEYKKKMEEAMMGTHMWNMSPYLFPDAFDTYIPPMY
ncbi:hypothetical protein JXI42_03070 [bacterium]|nr:hypothetical protein [bacterium]